MSLLWTQVAGKLPFLWAKKTCWVSCCQLAVHYMQDQQQQNQQHNQHRQQWQPWQPCQCFATAAEKQPLTLKAALRQLYKRVHPDLFADYPAEQAENERSFKLLQDYLHQARNPSIGPASRTAYHFRLYLTPQEPADLWGSLAPEDSEDEPPDANGSTTPQFELVQLVLVPPPPPRHAPSSQQQQQPLSSGARQGLRKLLVMCGFGDVLADDAEDEAADSSLQLTTFLPEAAEVVRQHESGPAKHETRVANLRAAFRLAHQVIAGFQPGAFSGPQQIELLQRLATALDLLSDDPPDLSGLHILICSRTALDSQGNLCLDASQEAEDWANFLGGVDPDYARDRRSSAAALRSLESQVAAAVGVRMLFTAGPYLMTHEYRAFLEHLAAHAATDGPVQPMGSSSSSGSSASRSSSGSLLSSVPVYVAPLYQQPDHQQQQVVHETMGYIQVPMNASAQQVYKSIQDNAPAAAAILTKRSEQQQEVSELTASVRSRLGLRRLLKDELISQDEFRSACKRLLYHRDLLLRCNVEGLSLRISDKNRVAEDGSLVDIAWNFDM